MPDRSQRLGSFHCVTLLIAKCLSASCRRRILTDRSGVAAVEFVLVAPVLIMMGLGFLVFGVAMLKIMTVSYAADAGISTLTISRGSSTPYTAATTAINNAATGLTISNITTTVTVNGTACSTNSTCATALSTAMGKSATVSLTYPCNLQFYGYNYGSSVCPYTSTVTGMVQ